MLIDIGGGQYRDLDLGTEYTCNQFCDVITEKISFEFAEIIREMIGETNEEMKDLEIELDLEAATSAERYEVIQRIRNLSREFKDIVKNMERMDRKKIVSMFKEIETECENYL